MGQCQIHRWKQLWIRKYVDCETHRGFQRLRNTDHERPDKVVPAALREDSAEVHLESTAAGLWSQIRYSAVDSSTKFQSLEGLRLQ